MNNLLKSRTKNQGGMLRFVYCIAEEISVFPAAVDKVVSNPIQLISGASWYYGYCTQGKNNFKEDWVRDGQDGKYKISFGGFIPEMGPERSMTVEELNATRVVVIGIDNTLIRRVIIGSPTNPCRTALDFDSGKSFPDSKGHSVVFLWENLQKCNFYDVPVAYPSGPGGGA